MSSTDNLALSVKNEKLIEMARRDQMNWHACWQTDRATG